MSEKCMLGLGKCHMKSTNAFMLLGHIKLIAFYVLQSFLSILGTPDHSYCLFHQKLQMINCCIERKILREKKGDELVTQVSRTDEDMEDMETDDNSSDEFFDCDDENPEESEPIWNRKPEGRLKKVGKLRLLNSSECLFEPVCQEPAPMTEDQLAEQAEVMLQLGMDPEGSELRAKMQSASLLSDMESFKVGRVEK